MIYVVTNRRIDSRHEDGKLVETIHDGGEETARPVFRVATVELDGKDPKKDRATLVPDEYVESYDDLTADQPVDAVFGTRRMFLDLYRCMAEAPKGKGDTLVFLHGFQYTFEASMAHIRKLSEIYLEAEDCSVANLVYFSWPSAGSLTEYKDDQVDAIESGKLLGRLFRKTRQFFMEFFGDKADPRNAFCGQRIHLAAHSMGNQVLTHMIHELNHYPQVPFSMFGEVLLLNGDADWNVFEPGEPLHRLPEYCERTHVYNNYSDDALWISQHTKNFVKRLGRHGPASLDRLPARTKVVDASGLKAKGGKVPSAARDGFVTRAAEITGQKVPTRERLMDHWGYLYRPEVIADVKAVLGGVGSTSIEGRTPTPHPNLFKLGSR
ncbi:MAG: alpha/beta hydrolase [Verrucomicrobiales bacterium]|nr:alpha/beta hydrolase [Verrucomicrobiales bacterium]